jgi:hypothetical protein
MAKWREPARQYQTHWTGNAESFRSPKKRRRKFACGPRFYGGMSEDAIVRDRCDYLFNIAQRIVIRRFLSWSGYRQQAELKWTIAQKPVGNEACKSLTFPVLKQTSGPAQKELFLVGQHWQPGSQRRSQKRAACLLLQFRKRM